MCHSLFRRWLCWWLVMMHVTFNLHNFEDLLSVLQSPPHQVSVCILIYEVRMSMVVLFKTLYCAPAKRVQQ